MWGGHWWAGEVGFGVRGGQDWKGGDRVMDSSLRGEGWGSLTGCGETGRLWGDWQAVRRLEGRESRLLLCHPVIQLAPC